VFDTAGGARLPRSHTVLRAGGRLVSVAEEPPDGGVYFTVEPNRDQLSSLARLADVGELQPPSVVVFPLTSAREAFARSLEPSSHRAAGVGASRQPHSSVRPSSGRRARPLNGQRTAQQQVVAVIT
jgi:NADPH:quinone reductase-like Zn-dependent oxidoreductase